MAREVVVTGVGIVSAIGNDVDTVWSNLLGGETGLGPITVFDASLNKVQNAAEVDLSALDERQKGKLRRADRTLRYAVEVARQALVEAGWRDPAEENVGTEVLPIASVWGSGSGAATTLYESHKRFGEKGPKGMRPSTIPACMANSISAGVSIHHRLGGTNQVIVSACTSSTNAIGQGLRMIRDGYVDAVLCGGVEAGLDPFYYGVWNNLGVLSPIADPKRAVRPFDSAREGTLLGEGGGAVLLEAAEVAAARGAAVRARVLGYGESSDATHMTAPDEAGQVRAIRAALQDARIDAAEVGFVNAHGTGTPANDVTEAQSVRAALGPAADNAPVGANKSYFGHTLGASGVLEGIATILGLEAGRVPPNLNLESPDPACEVPLVGGQSSELPVRVAMKNSFGFGGGNGVLLFGRAD